MTAKQLTDSHGLAVSTLSDTSAAAYARGVELLMGFSPEAVVVLRAAVESDPHFGLAQVALECALAAAGVPAEAPQWCDRSPLSRRASTRRERQHIEVLRMVLNGERERAAVLGREHLHEFPEDILVAHVLTSHGLS